MVKELRQRTGAGMMECKKSLAEAGGDIDKAVELLRKAGQAKADGKSGRVAAEGLISTVVADDESAAVLLEVNSETDFVAKEERFRKFCGDVAHAVLAANPPDREALDRLQIGGEDVESARCRLVARSGENIQLRRFVRVALRGDVHAVYMHNNRIGVIVDMDGGNPPLAKDLAMHVAASRPMFLTDGDVPAEWIEKEKEILTEQAAREGKPANIVEKMVQGRLKKRLNEITLAGQPFVKDPDVSIAELLHRESASVIAFYRYEIGEGMEKKKENFAEEVMAQIQ